MGANKCLLFCPMLPDWSLDPSPGSVSSSAPGASSTQSAWDVPDVPGFSTSGRPLSAAEAGML